MKKLLLIAATALALFACKKDPVSGPGTELGTNGDELVLSFRVTPPPAGKMVLSTLATDPLALIDEARINRLQIYIFGHQPNTDGIENTSDWILESAPDDFTVFAADGSTPSQLGQPSASQTNGTAYTIDSIKVKQGGIKHFYFVANADALVTHLDTTFTETQMIQALQEMVNLPRVVHTNPASLTVTPQGLPMSAYAEVDCTNPHAPGKPGNNNTGRLDVPEDIVLKRVVARYDVINATLNYKIVSTQAYAYDQAYLFDTLPLKALPANTFASHYLINHTPNNVEGAGRDYDYIGNRARYLPAVILPGDGLLPRKLNDNGTNGNPGDSLDDYLENAMPVAMGYLWPSPAAGQINHRDSTVFVRVELKKRTSDNGTIYDLTDDTYSNEIQLVDVYFMKNEVPEAVKRNHVYRITILEEPVLTGSFEVEEWIPSTANLIVPVDVPSVICFEEGSILADTAFMSGLVNAQPVVNFFADGGAYRVKLATEGQMPTTGKMTRDTLDTDLEWITFLNAAPGTPLPSCTFVKNIGSNDAPNYVVDVQADTMDLNLFPYGREFVLYITLENVPTRPTSSIRFKQLPRKKPGA